MNTLSKLAKNKKALLVLAAAAFAVIAFAKPALLPFALLMLCPLMHLFMHGGHGSHGTHGSHGETAARLRRRADGELVGQAAGWSSHPRLRHHAGGRADFVRDQDQCPGHGAV